MNDFICNTKKTCEFFGISRDALSEWAKRGAPKIGRGQWDIQAIMNWRYGADGSEESAAARKLAAEAAYKQAKSEQEQIKLAVLRQEFIPADEVTRYLVERNMIIKSSLLRLSKDIAIEIKDIDMESARRALKIIDNRVYDFLQQLSEDGEYVKKRNQQKR